MRFVEVNADLSGVQKKYRPIVQKAIKRMEEVLGSQYWLYALHEEIQQSNDLEGELSKWKTANHHEIDFQFFNRLENAVFHSEFIIQTYYTPQRVIGYGVASDDITRINTKYLSKYTIDDEHDLKEIGSNLVHEKFHDRGMQHDKKNTARRKNSVAYIANRAYERAYEQLFIENAPKPVVKVLKRKPWWRFW